MVTFSRSSIQHKFKFFSLSPPLHHHHSHTVVCFSWPARGILVPQPGIEPSAVLTTGFQGTPQGTPEQTFFFFLTTCFALTDSAANNLFGDKAFSPYLGLFLWFPRKWKRLIRVRLFSGWPFPSPGDLPNPGIESRSPTLQADSLSAEPQRKTNNTGVGSLSLLQGIFPTQELNQGLLPCRQILYQLSY